MTTTDKSTPTTDLRPARGYSWEQFKAGNELQLVHGAYSSRLQAERAETVRSELLIDRPDLAAPEQATLVAAYARAVARDELSQEAIEGGTMNARLLESASSAGRLVKELGTELGIGDRAAAELRQIRSQAALNVATLARETPLVLAAMEAALIALGLTERVEEFRQALGAQLAEIAGD